MGKRFVRAIRFSISKSRMNGNVRYWSILQLHRIAQRTSAWDCARRHNVTPNPSFERDAAKARRPSTLR